MPIFLILARFWGGIPARVQHYLELAVVVAVAVTWWTLHFEHKAVAEKMAAINKASAKVEAAAVAKIQTLNTQHAKEVAANETVHQSALALADAAHASDLDRLRQLDADRQARAVLDSTAGLRAALEQSEARLRSLEPVAAGLAGALRVEVANSDLCYADRDSLTGK